MRRVYLLMIVIGIILTPIAREVATNQRGYTATGGEVLIIPFFILVGMLIGQLWEMWQILKDMYIEDKIVFKKEKSQ